MTEPRLSTPIDAIAEAWVDTETDLYPEYRVMLGRPGREGEYADYSPEGLARVIEATTEVLAAISAAEPVDAVDEITKLDLSETLRLAVERQEAGLPLRDLNVIASPAQELRDVFDLMPSESEDDWARIAERMHNLPAAMDGYLTTLRAGIREGVVPSVRQVIAVAAQADRHAAPDGFFADLAERGAHRAVADRLATGAVASATAYARLASFLRNELAPVATEADAVGRDLYSIASRGFLGATIDLDETYEWGLEELARMSAEQEAIAKEILPGASVQEAIAHLEADPSRTLQGTGALQAWMQETSDRAIEELGRIHFDIPEQLRRLECMIAPTQEGGIYYTPPADDFSRAGRMWWSVPEGVTRFSTWRELTTVYHEGVPGHHLQIGQAVHNRAQLNSWRRNAGTSGHAEGWALYAERLMADLGYLEPAERFGMLDGQRMRAARVVLDIGVHLGKRMPGSSRSWTGDDAFGFLAANVTMDEAFVRFEVDRYLGWPGQAPSYKVGQRLWEQLRDEAAAREGAAFDIRSFHKRALDIGGVGLDTLRFALAPRG
ncbi:DUF885 domain-containing protein [soil metagenome]